MRIEHNIRTGTDATPLPSATHGVNALRRTADAANHSFLHDVFNHCSTEKIFQTLGVTKGYNQIRLPDQHCDTCATTKSRGFGLRQKTFNGEQPAGHMTALIETLDMEPEDELDEMIAYGNSAPAVPLSKPM